MSIICVDRERLEGMKKKLYHSMNIGKRFSMEGFNQAIQEILDMGVVVDGEKVGRFIVNYIANFGWNNEKRFIDAVDCEHLASSIEAMLGGKQ